MSTLNMPSLETKNNFIFDALAKFHNQAMLYGVSPANLKTFKAQYEQGLIDGWNECEKVIQSIHSNTP